MERFWETLLFVVFIYMLFLILLNPFLRKWLHVEKRKLFSYHHVNDRHKNIEWIVRISFICLLLMGSLINVNRDPLHRIWFLETYILLIIFIIVTEVLRIIMEKRYAENKKDYIYSAIQLAIGLFFILLIVWTTIFGLFEA